MTPASFRKGNPSCSNKMKMSFFTARKRSYPHTRKLEITAKFSLLFAHQFTSRVSVRSSINVEGYCALYSWHVRGAYHCRISINFPIFDYNSYIAATILKHKRGKNETFNRNSLRTVASYVSCRLQERRDDAAGARYSTLGSRSKRGSRVRSI